MKRLGFICAVVWLTMRALSIQSPQTMYPFAGAVGTADSTAIHMSDPRFVGWADGYASISYGSEVVDKWKVPAAALGEAVGVPDQSIVCLGRGGQMTLTFSRPIKNGDGFDFAVFENAVNSIYLELAWVEVSSDGEHFCRFPNYYGGSVLVPQYGGHSATDIYGLASKYQRAYGHPFDLAELQEAYDACFPAKPRFFTETYANSIKANYPYLNLNQISHVRIIDIVGNGSAIDTSGRSIYDPYPTTGSAGFDLDAVGVIHQADAEGDPQEIIFDPIPHQQLDFQTLKLLATADSGLPVSFAIQSGPATNNGNQIFFTGTGTVEVVASQDGNETYAPASPVLRSFIVAEVIQHIFVEPVPNQLKGGGVVQVNAYSSSGLPVKMQVQSGPDSVLMDEDTHLLNLGTESGAVTLLAFQPGDAATAPAENVYVDFQIVETSASNAPIAFADWMVFNPVPEPSIQSSEDAYGRPSVMLSFELDTRAAARCRIVQSPDLMAWTNCIPELVGQTNIEHSLHLSVQVPAVDSNQFFRLVFEEQQTP